VKRRRAVAAPVKRRRAVAAPVKRRRAVTAAAERRTAAAVAVVRRPSHAWLTCSWQRRARRRASPRWRLSDWSRRFAVSLWCAARRTPGFPVLGTAAPAAAPQTDGGWATGLDDSP